MILLQSLQDYAKAKGLTLYENRDDNGTLRTIGVNLNGKYSFYWWTVCFDGIDLLRHHIYSQNTGKTSRSFKRFFAAEDKIKSFKTINQ